MNQSSPQPRITKVSEQCLDVIRHFEELRLSAYLCPAGKATIGWGATRYPDGRAVKLGDRIDRQNAVKQLRFDIIWAEKAVDDLTRDDLTQQEFDALASFVFNAGTPAYRTSTLRKIVNSRTADEIDIQYRFGQWKNSTIDGRLVRQPGLVRRRKCEAHLYNTGEVNFFEDEKF